ncbi:TATA box-binding protein-associated factor RNA polymerase I subunit B-like isoform X2 [Biomphalaria glabrata]|uniref:TATA box-binding protein-associated factor RNA polymerase I subunit B n=1 Tax=Biomphalaria glabrata TaxID=6526 RepID=A0A9W3BMH6_BIOGL|nr:TATA box-binding protein-associated factor RNA polymerase I subunit B-like isoform X2 [Biomphalaria glabrata]
MPFDCHVCGNKDYDEQDGLYFCTECGTQSQDLHVQEVDFCADVNAIHQVKSSQNDGATRGTYRPKVDLGRPWTIYEAYQIIIIAQAEALVGLGAKEELKDIIFTIWANYLSLLGVAFCDDERIVPDVVEKFRVGRARELRRGSFDTPLNKKMKKTTILEKDSTKENSLFDEILESEENTDDSFIKKFDSSDEGESKNKSQKKFYRKRYEKAKLSPEWMNLEKTIAICFIGVLHTNPEILLHDIVRWIYESKIPFLSTSHLLPSNMVLSGGDQSLFKVGKFDTKVLLKEVNKLCTYLVLKSLPAPDIKELIMRFVKELYLPNEVMHISCNLADRIPYLSSAKTHYIRHDHQAMAYIILGLRLVFGIDDSTEYLLSEYSSKLQECLHPDTTRLFIWTDWKKLHIYKSSEVFDLYKELTCDVSSAKMNHLDSLVSSYTNLGFDKKKLTTFATLNIHQRPVRCFEKEFRESLRKPLDAALERFENFNQKIIDKSDGAEQLCRLKGENFINSSLCHIVNVDLFKKQTTDRIQTTEAEMQLIISKYLPPKSEVSQYKYLSSGDDLIQHRHQNYLWLLQMASQSICCKLIELDRLVVRFTDYLIAASSNMDMSNTVCTTWGTKVVTKRKKKLF